jgi:hypothetical protein
MRWRARCDLGRNVLCVAADPADKHGTDAVLKWKTEEVKARLTANDPPVVLWHAILA